MQLHQPLFNFSHIHTHTHTRTACEKFFFDFALCLIAIVFSSAFSLQMEWVSPVSGQYASQINMPGNYRDLLNFNRMNVKLTNLIYGFLSSKLLLVDWDHVEPEYFLGTLDSGEL